VRDLQTGQSLLREPMARTSDGRYCIVALQSYPSHNAETLRKLKSDVTVRLPYSPDLARSDYNLFGPLKEALRSR
jgi:hypothetical protein